jgi:hypothetical protein
VDNALGGERTLRYRPLMVGTTVLPRGLSWFGA